MLQITVMTLVKSTFPAPGHDHGRCTADAMIHAEQVCARRAQKFTPIRRQVLQALLSSHRPLGAYEVIDELAKSMPRPAPRMRDGRTDPAAANHDRFHVLQGTSGRKFVVPAAVLLDDLPVELSHMVSD